MSEIDAPAAQPVSESFRFTGNGGEYFRIWIVNLLLSILTLGIYSAWAKVRRLQYFYRHTQVAGAGFDYHGDPKAILFGRIIAVILLLAYNYAANWSLTAWAAALAVLAAVMPWLLRNSFRFRLRYSSYRGLRFRFSGSVAGAYDTFLFYPVMTLVTFYLALPLAHQRLKSYQHGNSHYGQERFTFSATVRQFYGQYLAISLLFLLIFVGAIAYVAVATFVLLKAGGGAKPDPQAITAMVIVMVVLIFGGMLMISPLWQARMQNLVWNNTRLGEHRFESRVRALRLFGIHISNFILIVLTLGLFMPWAAVRAARYRVESMTLLPAGSIEAFVARQEQAVNAAGEEAAEFFDFDIAL